MASHYPSDAEEAATEETAEEADACPQEQERHAPKAKQQAQVVKGWSAGPKVPEAQPV